MLVPMVQNGSVGHTMHVCCVMSFFARLTRYVVLRRRHEDICFDSPITSPTSNQWWQFASSWKILFGISCVCNLATTHNMHPDDCFIAAEVSHKNLFPMAFCCVIECWSSSAWCDLASWYVSVSAWLFKNHPLRPWRMTLIRGRAFHLLHSYCTELP